MSAAAIAIYQAEIETLSATLAVLEIRRAHSIEGQSVSDDRYEKTLAALAKLNELLVEEQAKTPFMIIEV